MKIIDLHVHVGDVLFGWPQDEPYDRVPWSPGWITEITGYRTSSPPPGFRALARYLEVIHNQQRNHMATLPNLVQHASVYGAATIVLQPIAPYRTTQENLETIAEFNASPRPGPSLTLKTFASVHPLDPDKEASLSAARLGGALGLKLHPIIQNLAPEHPAWTEVLELWKPTGKPVLIHSGVSAYYLPRSRRDEYGDATRYEPWVRAFPEIPFIMAHLNMLHPETVYELARKYDNVFADLSFQSAKRIRQAKPRLGVHRLLYASDFPFSLPRYALKAGLAATADDPEFRERFFHANAAKLLGLEAGP
jgi:hypothetical protein